MNRLALLPALLMSLVATPTTALAAPAELPANLQMQASVNALRVGLEHYATAHQGAYPTLQAFEAGQWEQGNVRKPLELVSPWGQPGSPLHLVGVERTPTGFHFGAQGIWALPTLHTLSAEALVPGSVLYRY